MDMKRTGELIAAARREKGLTQRELAERLHVSDRTVSKWERGAGFPDVSILERLAAALELNVLDLLRGERTEERDVEAALREAMEAFRQQRRRERGKLLKESVPTLLLLLVIAAFWLNLNPPTTKIDQTITAGVYQGGALVAYTPVELQGEVNWTVFNGKRDYWGRFAIGCVEWTNWEDMVGGLTVEGRGGLGYTRNGLTTMALYDPGTLCSRDMRDFAFTLADENTEDWLILASSPQMYEEYRASRANVPALQSVPGDWTPDFRDPWTEE